MPRCWIGVGSNLQRETSVRAAVRDLRQRFGALLVSPVYETAAVGGAGPPFFNLVVGIETPQPMAVVRAQLAAIETANGRLRGSDRHAPRTLDLDLLTYGQARGLIDGYQVPRAEILDYAFVLAPLAAVAPTERHPQLQRTYAELWRGFDLVARGQAAPRPLTFTLEDSAALAGQVLSR